MAKQHSKGVSTQATAFAPRPSARFMFLLHASLISLEEKMFFWKLCCRINFYHLFQRAKEEGGRRQGDNQNNDEILGFSKSKKIQVVSKQYIHALSGNCHFF